MAGYTLTHNVFPGRESLLRKWSMLMKKVTQDYGIGVVLQKPIVVIIGRNVEFSPYPL